MTPKQWLALLCFYILYLLFGASVFYYYEHNKELEERAQRLQKRIHVNELLVKFASPDDEEIQNKVLAHVSDYCGRPVTNYTLDEYPEDYRRTFYHAFWFAFIVCSTLGYGSSSPHDLHAQAFLIFYGLIGLPLNGFVLTYLGDFFSKAFIGMYKRYKGQEYAATQHYDVIKKFGLVSRIMMLLIPGIAFFIFLPACIFTYFEDWPYVTSVYYAFITLTTIGFGDYVPTFQNGQARKFGIYFTFYQIFIVLWDVIGTGYFIMIIGFIAKGLQSKRIARLEHQLSMNIKETQNRIWSGVTKDLSFLRSILNEVNLMKFTPVYTDSTEKDLFNSFPRSLSCPELTIYQEVQPQHSRKRTYSDSYGHHRDSSTKTSTMTLHRVQSDGDLSRIDKKRTFQTFDGSSLFQTQDILSNIITALDSIGDELSNSQIFTEEKRKSQQSSAYSEDSCTNRPPRQRAFSAFHILQHESLDNSNESAWNANSDREIEEYLKNRPKKFSIASIFANKPETTLHVPTECRNRSFISKINPFKARERDEKRHSVSIPDPQTYLNNTARGRESRFSLSQTTMENMELLEKTTIADLIRAVEEVQAQSNVSSHAHTRRSSIVNPNLQLPSHNPRRDSLRPVPAYTTVFTSQNISQNTASSHLARDTTRSSTRSRGSPDATTPNLRRRNIMSADNARQSQILRRTFSLRPSPLAASTHSPPSTPSQTLPQTPTITVQPPDTEMNVLWSSGIESKGDSGAHQRSDPK
ncbi:open rectifier potassium channel protein 1-like isoform X1 [Bradysia coprophila]|uniref:open rectifier potassium channel protein 1-like isoform X1 n=1 Tax=Bradysia coprophila TaxID=38358 RepID=UPI00187DD055|nr:open rectifier potassium channel protein 1-like isoform X1 [Bradysia coprophila]